MECFKRSAENGNGAAMALYGFCLKLLIDSEAKALGDIWISKAFSSKNAFAIGFCLHFKLVDSEEHGSDYFLASAKDGDEYGQYYTGFVLGTVATRD